MASVRRDTAPLCIIVRSHSCLYDFMCRVNILRLPHRACRLYSRRADAVFIVARGKRCACILHATTGWFRAVSYFSRAAFEPRYRIRRHAPMRHVQSAANDTTKKSLGNINSSLRNAENAKESDGGGLLISPCAQRDTAPFASTAGRCNQWKSLRNGKGLENPRTPLSPRFQGATDNGENQGYIQPFSIHPEKAVRSLAPLFPAAAQQPALGFVFKVSALL